MVAKAPARCLMVQGTGSHAGKSVLVAALCRILAREGWRVAPFKSQNMSLNSYVTCEGGEMGRAQVLQAQAAGIEPHTDMNPILLKPSSDEKAQVILNGRPVGHMDAREYHLRKPEFLPPVLQALERLRAAYDLVILEGAGSPAEINLKREDIANMRMAQAAQAPVLLVGDIDRGGVFASLLGTLELLDPAEREMVAGLVINKFRGARELLQDGLDLLAARTGKPVLGVVPYIRDLGLEEEDSVYLEGPGGAADGHGEEEALDIVVVRLPHISNATDLDPLALEPGVRLRFLSGPARLGDPDAVIIPGTKATCDDLEYLRGNGMARALLDLHRRGVPVIGICGGYQMLGEMIEDPLGVECREKAVEGLGILPVVTRMGSEKSTHRVEAVPRVPIPLLGLDEGASPMSGYEIHMGVSRVKGDEALLIVERDGMEVEVRDGSFVEEPPAFGCYLHGLFENRAPREGFLDFLRRRRGMLPLKPRADWKSWHAERLARLDRVADVVLSSLDMPRIRSLLGIG